MTDDIYAKVTESRQAPDSVRTWTIRLYDDRGEIRQFAWTGERMERRPFKCAAGAWTRAGAERKARRMIAAARKERAFEVRL